MTQKRLKDTQAALTRASEANKKLTQTLTALGWRPPTAPGPSAPPAPQTPGIPAAAPPAPPTPAQAAPPQRWEISDQAFDDFHRRYSDASVDDKGALRLLLNETVSMLMQALPDHLAQHSGFLDRLTKAEPLLDASTRHFEQRTALRDRAVKQVQAVEGFWKESVPQIPPKFLWQYGPEAERLYPGDLPKQALHCVQRVLEELGPVLTEAADTSKITEGIQRGQGPVLPAGPTPLAGAGAGTPALSFVDQLQRANQGL